MGERTRERPPVLVAGLPRSGSTWTAKILAAAPGCDAVMEPDNEKTSAPAISAKRGLGRYPVLAPGEEAPAYRDLWTWALSGRRDGRAARLGDRLLHGADARELEELVSGRPAVRTRLAARLGKLRGPVSVTTGAHCRTVAKTVHACLSLEWLADEFSLEVVVVRRHPANVLASWLELELPDSDRHLELHQAVRSRFMERWDVPPPGPTPLERAAWQVGLLSAALDEAVRSNPRWHVRSHESLCRDPLPEFRRLFDDTGLEWGDQPEILLAEGEQPGAGFSLHRRAEELPDAWRRRLDESQVSTLRRVLARFPVDDWWAEDDRAGSRGAEVGRPVVPGTRGPTPSSS